MADPERKLMQARVEFLRRDASPFFATILLHHKFREGGVDTMATDGHTLFWNKHYVDSLTPKQLHGLLAHEMLHVARAHHLRREGRDPKKWNYACDAAIDHDLKEAGFDVPDSFAESPRWAWAKGLSAERIYAQLPADDTPPQPRSGGVRDTPAPEGETVRHAIMIRQAVMAEKGATRRGTAPAWLKALISDLTAPRTNWQNVLRQFLGSAVPQNLSYRSPNRRYRSLGVYYPGAVKAGVSEGVVLLDTSGSMGAQMGRALSEVRGIINDLPRERIHVMQCDASVADLATYEPTEELQLTVRGLGGSDFRPAFKRIEDEQLNVNWMVLISDMDIAFPDEAPAYPVLAFSTTNRSGPAWASNYKLERA